MKKHKWLKRILIAGCVLLLVAVGLVIGLNQLRHRRPDWYPAKALDPAALNEAVQSVRHKFEGVQDWAADTNARERTQLSGRDPVATDSSDPPDKTKTISLTDAELNAFFSQWDNTLNLSDKYGQYLTDPVLVLQDGRIILAANVKELDTIVSIHLEPRLDEQGMLHLEIVKLMSGSLPLPQSFFSAYRDKFSRMLEGRIAQESQRAKIAPDGSANGAAVAAGMNLLLLHALNNEPADPILFLPHDLTHSGNGLPVRLTAVKIENKTITMTVQPLTAEQRQELLQKLKQAGTNQRRAGDPAVDANEKRSFAGTGDRGRASELQKGPTSSPSFAEVEVAPVRR
jgi:hypothetical protein